jgi:hypothetical protein
VVTQVKAPVVGVGLALKALVAASLGHLLDVSGANRGRWHCDRLGRGSIGRGTGRGSGWGTRWVMGWSARGERCRLAGGKLRGCRCRRSGRLACRGRGWFKGSQTTSCATLALGPTAQWADGALLVHFLVLEFARRTVIA